jgi:DNA-binding GntR family transcriptional regulator
MESGVDNNAMDKQPEFRTLRSWVLESLSEQILNGVLLPGHQLVETELSRTMGISRSPIREALRQLEQEGLVITLPNASTTVAPIRPSDVEQVFELRELLEPEIVARAAARGDIPGVAHCRILLEEMRTMVAQGDTISFAKADIGFHQALWLMGKRPKMSEILLRLSRETRRYIAFTARSLPGRTLYTSHGDHERILAAIDVGQTAEAAEAMRLHLATSCVRIVDYVVSMQKAMESQDGRNEVVLNPVGREEA